MISTCRPPLYCCIHVLETNQGYMCTNIFKAIIAFTENLQCSLKAYLCLFKIVWKFCLDILYVWLYK